MLKEFQFYREKYGCSLLVDVVSLAEIEKYVLDPLPHKLNYFDITFIKGGRGRFTVDNHEINVSKGQIFFSAPLQLRHWEVNQAPEGYALLFEEEFIAAFFNDAQFIRKLSFFCQPLQYPFLELDAEDGARLELMLIELKSEIDSGKDEHILRALLYQLLAWLENRHKTIVQFPRKNVPIVLQFEELLESHFDKEHCVEFYAEQLNVSTSHLKSILKVHTGKAVKSLISDRLLLEAQRLLRASTLSVSEIAYMLHFSEPAYFARFFKKHTGCAPRQYRSLNS